MIVDLLLVLMPAGCVSILRGLSEDGIRVTPGVPTAVGVAWLDDRMPSWVSVELGICALNCTGCSS